MTSTQKKEQAKDTGLAVILVLLLFVYLGEKNYLVLPAIVVLVLTMVWPMFFEPLSRVWFGFSHVLGGFVSKILLSIVFYIVVTPIGLLRRISGADSMKMKKWKKGSESVFTDRSHLFSKSDIEKPF